MESGQSEKRVQDKKHLRLTRQQSGRFQALDSELGKLPPQALELEEAVLGALLLEKDSLSLVMDFLKPWSFYKEAHQEIFNAILDVYNSTSPVDMLTVVNQLRKNGKLEAVGGAYYITELTTRVNSAANIEYHARIVVEMAIKRELIRIASHIHREAYEDSVDVFDMLDDAERQIFEITDSNSKKSYNPVKSILSEALNEIERRKSLKDGLTGVPTGITALDRVTSGWQPSDLVIIAARPGMGKTAFVLSALRNAAVQFNRPVAIFSLEMSSVQLVNRLISSEAEIESEKLKKGNLSDSEWQQMLNKLNTLEQAPIFVDDTPALSILELRAKARRLRHEHKIELLIIDYLQLMQGDVRGAAGGNREQEIASISRSLKTLAKELNIPVIALSQLSRAVETRGGEKRPQLSDLRESGSIEQDADMVMFLYRPEYYNITTDDNGMPLDGVAEAIIAKHRNGSLETVQMKFIKKLTRFTDLEGGFGGDLPEGNFRSITLGSRMNPGQESGSRPSHDTPF